ncbi:MAG: phosphonate metabolism protein/1,5-bisphosphokinase (PRPP-forming) PhnN [Gammaproteobacteria bacterium HGW-Gammaproteobacteria-1]|jgi:ribose 1,5-bisphosphokinase|nr:MAG: phosphonate metabolism protein/1,5-bisphosphokinase (PRPP-forming) PhnN [Gammaproteobacteria bacterium HGW-Gammaproteobacteria-1]PKO86543.1 MAG: phosphonate metabolism protein/1,5-bisphosphokinase (PRPP-forming) PhnN [Betaproteobacteria bacterium HGW-Betaproteobacteria-12]
MVEGKLFYVIGASGSGKDSLLRYARERLASDPGVVFAHRYITRPVELHGENHVALTKAEFDARLAAGLFAMYWASHGLHYGVGREINFWLAKGCNVVMNGSREYLPEARRRYPELTALLITVSPDVLAARLRARGRETEDQISRRIARARQFMRPDGPVEIIQNDAELGVAGERLVQLLSALAASPRAFA